MDSAVDFLSSVVEEVSLEGLDGITLLTLWLRLENRPQFPLSLNEDSKIFLWECIAVHKDIEIYKLPEPRPVLSIYNRFDYIDTESGVIHEPPNLPQDIYSTQQASDGEVRGACSTYKTRKCITSDIRYDTVLLLSLNQVVEQWGDSLVLVASPKLRLLALTGTSFNPLTEMSVEEYSLLERIGRSRYLGETSHGNFGLTALKAPFSRQLHYFRKKLSKKGLITKQDIYLKYNKGHTGTGRLFHLTRFYVQHKSKMQIYVQQMCDYLQKKPHEYEETKFLREALNIKERTFKKIFHSQYSKYFKMVTVPYRDIYPDAPEKACLLATGQEKCVKVVQLIKHCAVEEEDDDDDEEEAIEINGKGGHIYLDFTKLYCDLPLTTQAYIAIKSSGAEGMTATELARVITLPRLDIRNLVRNLTKRGILESFLLDRGKQKERRYIVKEYATSKKIYTPVEQSSNTKKKVSNMKQSKKRTLEESSTPKAKKVKFNEVVSTVVYEREGKDSRTNNVKGSSSSNFENIVSDVIEVESVEGSNKKLTDEVCKPPYTLSGRKRRETVKSDRCLTDRFLKRAGMVLNFLKRVHFTTAPDIQKHLSEKEKEEEYSFKLDRKSTKRIINKLAHDKKLKLFQASLSLDGDTKFLEFICETSLDSNDGRINAAIEEAKFKYYSVSKTAKGKKTAKPINEEMTSDDKENLVDNKDLIRKPLVFQPSIGRLFYGLQPKFIRAKTLHLFLCYLTHGYEGNLENIESEPLVYHKSMTWKRFVPPLTDYNKSEGWCYLADVISRMPLSVFLKVVNIRYEIPGIEKYLGQEGKEHCLLKHLPQELRNDLLQDRKYIYMITEVVKQLCYMGLVSFGPQVQKLKDQVYVHIHKKVKLVDTTISTPGYIYIDQSLKYVTKSYEFSCTNDADTYWIDLETICVHTPLGRYGMIAGKTITFTETTHKPEMVDTLKPKDFDDVFDDFTVPGDGLGAGGFDSSLFAHLKRNWCWGSIPWKQSEKATSNELSTDCSIQSLLKKNELSREKRPGRLQRLTKNTSLAKAKENKPKKQSINIPKEKVAIRKLKTGLRTLSRQDMKKPRRPYYDDKDKMALKKMSKIRCDWTAQEDSFLLLCKVASAFLDPKSRRLVVSHTVIRDLLHEHLPELAANKSSRACQRRVVYMMRNPTTINNVAVFLGESKQDKSLVDEFSVTKPPLTKENEWKQLFTSLVKKLMTKFTMSASDRCKYILLPETLSEFSQNYKITSTQNVFCNENPHKEPKSIKDVYCATLYALIVSSMAIVDEGNKWSYTLHKLYENYPDTLLRSIVAQLRKEKVIAAKKSTSKKEIQRVHSSSIPFRFSITYDNNLTTKFPIKIYDESLELVKKLIEIEHSSKYEISGKVSSGYSATILSLLISDDIILETEIPDQVIFFDETLSKEVRSNIVERMIPNLSSKESDELSKLLSNENSNGSTCLQKTINDKSLSITQCDSKNLRIAEAPCFTNASRFALYMLRQECSQTPMERVQHSQDYIVLNSCKIFCELKNTGKFSDSSFPILPAKVTKSLSAEYNAIDSKSSEDIAAEVISSICSFIPRKAFFTDENNVESLKITYEEYSSKTLHDAICIFNNILQSEVLGISETALLKEFCELSGELSIYEHLHLCRNAMLIIRVGISSFRYVATMHAKHWVIHSFTVDDEKNVAETSCSEKEPLESNANSNESPRLPKQNRMDKSTSREKRKNSKNQQSSEQNESAMDVDTDTQTTSDTADTCTTSTEDIFCAQTSVYKDVHFVTRTWRKPDGSLNVAELYKLLLTVLSHIISTPGVTELKVCERFSGVMQPVQTLELIEVLEKINCVHRYFCKSVTKRSLFSPRLDLYVTKHPEPGDIAHLESLPHAVFKVGKLKEHMKNIIEFKEETLSQKY